MRVILFTSVLISKFSPLKCMKLSRTAPIHNCHTVNWLFSCCPHWHDVYQIQSISEPCIDISMKMFQFSTKRNQTAWGSHGSLLITSFLLISKQCIWDIKAKIAFHVPFSQISITLLSTQLWNCVLVHYEFVWGFDNGCFELSHRFLDCMIFSLITAWQYFLGIKITVNHAINSGANWLHLTSEAYLCHCQRRLSKYSVCTCIF